MKSLIKFALFGALAVASTLPAAAQNPIGGTYRVVQQNPDGHTYSGTLRISRFAVGQMTWDGQAPLPAFQGYYDSGHLNFDLVYPGNLKGHYRSEIASDGSQLFNGTTTSNQGGGTGAWRATRI